MKKATGRRADYLSHQNKLAEVKLEETSARLDKQLITKSAAYQHERRQLAQELRDFAREKKRMIPRSQSPPPSSKTNLSGAIRKYSVPSKMQSTPRYLNVPSQDTGSGSPRRPRTKSRSLVDLPNELQIQEGGNLDDSAISYDLLPPMKRSNESLSNSWESGRKNFPQGLHTSRLSPKSSIKCLPPISSTESRNHVRSLHGDSVEQRKGELLLSVPQYPLDKDVTIPRQQGVHLRPLKIRDQTRNASEEVERSIKPPTSLSIPSKLCNAESNSSQDHSEVKQNTACKVTEKLPEHQRRLSPSSPRIRQRLEAESVQPHTGNTEYSGHDISLNYPGKFIIINSEAEEEQTPAGIKSSMLPSQPQQESYDQTGDNTDETASNTESVQHSLQSRHSRKISTGSQQLHLSTPQAPSQETLQRAVRKVSSSDTAPLINIAAAIHGKTRKAGTGLAPNLTNVFLDSTAYQSGESGDGNAGLALDSESVTVSNDSSPGRRLSHGVPMNAAERSRERGSLALRGNKVRQEDPSTADLIRYYQDVPEAAALAGISVEPLNLSELESCRYLRKYVPKSLREEDSVVE